jgi:hypothetical protein
MLFTSTTLAGLILTVAASGKSTPLFPDIADTTHASSQAASFFHNLFTAKSLHNATAWLSFFNPSQVVYFDATLGEQLPVEISFLSAVTSTFAVNATAYPLQILGDTVRGSVVYSVDTPGLFGAEIRPISAVDFLNGKITRQVDYWDGRNNSAADGRAPADQYPVGLGFDTVTEKAAPAMNSTGRALGFALSAGNVDAAAELFNSDAVLVDLTLRTRVEGDLAIGRYLQRAIDSVPYGFGSTLRHVLGTDVGGGYEWQTDGRIAVRNGITALELDDCGLVTQFTVVWDSSNLSATAVEALASLAVEI